MRILSLFFFALFAISVQSQVIIQPTPETISNWTKKNTVGFDLNEIAFVNWSPGGVSSVTGLFKGEFIRRYVKGNVKWGNELTIRYGLNKQDGIELRKTDDAFQFSSNFGYRRDTTSGWYHSARFNFNTQFTAGYAYPNVEKAISQPFAPAYTFLGIGAEYANKQKNFNLYISPLTMKNTLVLDQRLADQGAFGVKKAIYDICPSEMLGVTMCQATYHMMGEDLYKVIPELKDKIFFIHFRNARGNKLCFNETFHDNGELEMGKLLKLYDSLGIDVPIRVDHVPLMAGETQEIAGYTALGRLYAIGYLKGLLENL